jgi:hypothetical protein
MTATRKTPAPSNSPPPFGGTAYLEAVLAEVDALWQYAKVPLSGVAGVDVITATCDVPLDSNRKGQKFTFFPAGANLTTTPNLSINTKPPLTIINRNGSALSVGRLQAGRMEELENDGLDLRLVSPDAAPSGITVLRSVFAYQRNTNVGGGSSPANVLTKYPFNTVILNEIPGLSLDTVTNQFTLPARAYDWVEINISLAATDMNGVFLWNNSDNAYISAMTRVQAYYSPSRAAGKFTLAAPKTCEVHFRCTAGNPNGLGVPLNIASPASLPEQYGMIEFRSWP